MGIKSLDWVEKYRPRKLSQMVGHPTAIAELKNWAMTWLHNEQKDNAIILYGGPGTGKCCKGNTLILTDRGIIKIEDIVHKQIDFGNRDIDHGQTNFFDHLYDINDDEIDDISKDEDDNIKNISNIISISPKLNYDVYKIIDRYDMGKSDVITIKTRLGLELCGTPEHKIIIIDDNGILRFRKLIDISVSDHIAISYNTNIFNERLKLNFFYHKKRKDHSSRRMKNIYYMNQEIAELLGYIIAEGSDKDRTIYISNFDKEIVERILKICKDIDLKAHEIIVDNRLEGARIDSIAFYEFVYYLGYRKLAQKKEVPWSILQADRNSQVSFIRSIFDGDGTVGLGSDDNSPVIEYYSSSYELVGQLQIMLLNLGIISRLGTKKGATIKYKGEIRTYEKSYRLSIQGGGILKFAELINFFLPRKKEILNKCVETLENRDRWSDITFPNIKKIINRLYHELKLLGQQGKIIKKWEEEFVIGDKTITLNRNKSISCKEYLKYNNRQYQSLVLQYAVGKKQPSIYGLKRLLSIMEPVDYLPEYKYLKTLSNQFIFDNVITTKHEKTRVYDVTIDNVHSYIGNSIINHNTTSAHALANEMRWETIELNASDQRTAKIINKIVGSASQLGSLYGNVKRLIIIDEADNIQGTADRGGEKAIIDLIKKTNQPIILTANEFYDMSIGLRNSGRPIQFKAISPKSIVPVLRKIADAEGITYFPGTIEKIAENANGDLRGAINDLQAISQGKTRIEFDDIVVNQRDTKENIFKVLDKIFKGKDAFEAYRMTFNLDQNPEDLIQWIDENISSQYNKPADLEKAYNYISRSSLFLSRVRRRQNYNLWKYAGVLMTSGVSASHSELGFGFVKYQIPSYRKNISLYRTKRDIRDSIALKIGNHCHVSKRYALSDLFSFFKLMMKDEKHAVSISVSLKLSPEEIEFLTGFNAKTVQKIYDQAQFIIKKDIDEDIELFGRFWDSNISKISNIDESKKDKMTDKIKYDNEKGIIKKSQKSLFDFD